MSRSIAMRRQYRFTVESLESRELLSGSTPQAPITAADTPPAPPPSIQAALSPTSDPDGNNIIVTPKAIIVGQTAPGAMVQLDQTSGGSLGATTTADAQGHYQFTAPLPVG